MTGARPTATPRDDMQLMAAIAEGDQSAFAEIYQRHAALMFAMCLRIVRERSDAEEVLSEVFMELWRRAERYEPSRGAPVAYLINLTRSRAIDRLRAKQRDRAVIVDTPQSPDEAYAEVGVDARPDPLGATLDEERRQRVHQALDGLTALQRQAVELSFLQGMSHSQVAETLGEPLGTVKTRIRQGLLHLREALQPLYGGGATP